VLDNLAWHALSLLSSCIVHTSSGRLGGEDWFVKAAERAVVVLVVSLRLHDDASGYAA
jgi:hypothetical protein